MKKILTTLLLITVCGVTNAHELAPLELVQKVFTDKIFAKNTSDYSIGEYTGHPNINDLSENTELQFNLLESNENTAVVNITISDALSNSIDTYIHLEKDTQWNIAAFRTLAMTGMIEMIVRAREDMTDAEIEESIKDEYALIQMLKMENMTADEMYELMTNDKMDMVELKKEFHQKLAQLKLVLALDSKIIEHFTKNKDEFEDLRNKLINIHFNEETAKEEAPAHSKTGLVEQTETDAYKLLINSFSTHSTCKNCFEFVIGGVLDNTVGYFYIPNQQDVPKMDPSRIIMIRAIGNGWYVFKKT